jgi:hypothetical protein
VLIDVKALELVGLGTDVAVAPPRLRIYPLATATFDVEQLVRVIRRAVQPKSWESTEGVLIEPLGAALVIRHTEAVHFQVQRLLEHVQQTQGGTGMGMGGGMGGGGMF